MSFSNYYKIQTSTQKWHFKLATTLLENTLRETQKKLHVSGTIFLIGAIPTSLHKSYTFSP